jgi:2-polyprenyl-6-methoxyphenol hydroxylase-like FAD-dependent oxidoreductase
LRVGIVGIGTAGAAAAILLSEIGHEVEVFERVPDPSPVGAGMLIQPFAQRILERLGVADELESRSMPVRRIDARNGRGRRVLDFGYDDLDPNSFGWGVHRGTLFDLLSGAVAAAGVSVATGFEVRKIAFDGRWWLRALDGRIRGPFDLIVGADGARSRLRWLSGLCVKDVGYPYGALWAIVPDPNGLAGQVLTQRYRDTRTVLGFLPTGAAQASIFWSVRSRELETERLRGTEAWRAEARSLAGPLAPLVDAVGDGELLAAHYRDVVVRTPVRTDGKSGMVLLGDAAHAMSPQLGLGANLALADAWTLACSFAEHPRDLGAALDLHARRRRAHVRWYALCSRLMTPVFQSGLVPIAWPRDLLFEPAARIPWVRRQFVTTLLGLRTSPVTTWTPPVLPAAGRDFETVPVSRPSSRVTDRG